METALLTFKQAKTIFINHSLCLENVWANLTLDQRLNASYNESEERQLDN